MYLAASRPSLFFIYLGWNSFTIISLHTHDDDVVGDVNINDCLVHNELLYSLCTSRELKENE